MNLPAQTKRVYKPANTAVEKYLTNENKILDFINNGNAFKYYAYTSSNNSVGLIGKSYR